MRPNDGFALIEVLVAGLVLMLTLLGAAAVLLSAFGQLDRSGEQTAAVALGQQRVEWLRNQAYTASELAAGTRTELLTGIYEGYTRVTKIVDDSPRAGVKTITVVTSTPGGMSTQIVALLAEQ
jgi:Tfp pilus assembly protein PilV